MVEVSQRLRLASEEIAGKVVDGEAIVMNLGNGLYYNMNPAASRVWELSEKGYALEDVVRALSHEFAVDEDTARADVLRLAAELVDEGLLVADRPSAESAWSPNGPGADAAYVTPELEKYSDMAELLALDPPMPGVAESPWLEPEGE